MELRQIRYFTKTAETLNFSEAARQLCVTQGTLSQQISSLEGELGVQLFERSKHAVSLTDVGKAFLPSAQRTLKEASSCMERIHDVLQVRSGEISVGTTFTFSPLLKETILEFMKLYPGIRLNIFCKSMEELLGMLKRQEIDIALSYRPENIDVSIESHVLFDNQLCVVMAENHPLVKEKSLRLRDIEAYPLCLPAKGMQARNKLDRIIHRRNDWNPNMKVEINDINILLDLVRNSSMLTFLSQATVIHSDRIASVALDEPHCEMQGSFHIVKDSYMKFATREFVKLLCQNRSFSMAMLKFL